MHLDTWTQRVLFDIVVHSEIAKNLISPQSQYRNHMLLLLCEYEHIKSKNTNVNSTEMHNDIV